MLVAGLLAFVPIGLMADSGDSNTPVYLINNKSLGFQAGALSGIGLSYQQWMGANGFQVTAGILPSYGSDIRYNVGAEYQRSIFGNNANEWLSGQLYIYGAGFHGGSIDLDSGRFDPAFGIGVGIGIETILFSHFSIPVGLVNGIGYTPNELTKFDFILLPQIGFRYRYK